MSSKRVKIAIVSLFLSGYRLLTGGKGVKDKMDVNDDIRNIAIFSTTALGDFMFNTPAIMAIKARYPAADLTLVSSHKNQSLVQKSPWFKRVIYWDQKIEFVPVLIFKLRKKRPDIVLLLHSKAPYDILCATLCGAKYIFKDGYNKNDLTMQRFVTLMTRSEFNGHLIERKLHLVSSLGCNTEDIRMHIPFLFTKPVKDEKIIKIGFQLGASEISRQWPVYRFQELAGLLFSSAENYRVVLTGAAQEKELANEFLTGLSAEERRKVDNYVGCFSLTELVEAISGLDFLVTGDTGPLHLAVALKVKTISLFATANPEHTGPLQDPELHTILRVSAETADEQPMAAVSAAEVMAAITAHRA